MMVTDIFGQLARIKSEKKVIRRQMKDETKVEFHSELNRLHGEFLEEYINNIKDDGRVTEEECFIIRRVFEFIKAKYNKRGLI